MGGAWQPQPQKEADEPGWWCSACFFPLQTSESGAHGFFSFATAHYSSTPPRRSSKRSVEGGAREVHGLLRAVDGPAAPNARPAGLRGDLVGPRGGPGGAGRRVATGALKPQ